MMSECKCSWELEFVSQSAGVDMMGPCNLLIGKFHFPFRLGVVLGCETDSDPQFLAQTQEVNCDQTDHILQDIP